MYLTKINMLKIVCIIIVLLIILVFPIKVNAVLKANKPDTNNVSLVNTTASDFFTAIRQMETEDGTLGKASDIDGTTAVDKTTGGNGIDCHMIKATEWGGIALLTASNYGTAPVGNQNDASTTGNKSGIYQMANTNREMTATSYKNNNTEANTDYVKNISTANPKYKNIYSSNITKISGDLVGVTEHWFQAGDSSHGVSNSNSIVNYNGGTKMYLYWQSAGEASNVLISRAVVVCGNNL